MLHGLIRDHLHEFLGAAADDRADGAGLPEFIAREFREFLTCGVLAHGFARVRCAQCAFEHLVPFSCKGRGFCPSCGARRMTERAAQLVDGVIPPCRCASGCSRCPFGCGTCWRGITVSVARYSRSMHVRSSTSTAGRPSDRASPRAAPGP